MLPAATTHSFMTKGCQLPTRQSSTRQCSTQDHSINQLKNTIELAVDLPTLTDETIQAANLIAETIEEDMPAVIVQLGADADIHHALSLPASPVVQGATPAASRMALEAWIIGTADAFVAPGQHFQGMAWHHMTQAEEHRLVYGAFLIHEWAAAIQTARLAGPVATVLLVEPTGRGRGTLSVCPKVFD